MSIAAGIIRALEVFEEETGQCIVSIEVGERAFEALRAEAVKNAEYRLIDFPQHLRCVIVNGVTVRPR